MQLAALAMSESLITETLPPVGYEQSLRPARRHSLTTHPDSIEFVIDSEAHIGLRDMPETREEFAQVFRAEGLPDPYQLEEFITWADERGVMFDLADYLEHRRLGPAVWFAMFAGEIEPFWWTPRIGPRPVSCTVNGQPVRAA
jgi:hypothetical protein